MKKTILLLISVILIVAGSTFVVNMMINFYMPTKVSGFSDEEKETLCEFFGVKEADFSYIYAQGNDTVGAEMIFISTSDDEIPALFDTDGDDWHDYTDPVHTPNGNIYPLKKMNTLNWTYYFYKSENRTRVFVTSYNLTDTEAFFRIFNAHK